jgi:choline dehydrogenase-like flavoprotein
MAVRPKIGETDTVGRPYGMSYTHVIDATVLPSIPATTITLTVMANAYRIGESVARFVSSGAQELRV